MRNSKSLIGVVHSISADIWEEKTKKAEDFHLRDVGKVKKEDVVTAVRVGQVRLELMQDCRIVLQVWHNILSSLIRAEPKARHWYRVPWGCK